MAELSIADFGRVRSELSRRPSAVNALAALCAAEPGLERRLSTRVLPAVHRLARELLWPGLVVLDPHAPGAPARTSVPRAQVGSWVALMLLGMLDRPTPHHPAVDGGPLLASAWPWEHAKLRCLLEYFDRIADALPLGQVEIQRVVVRARSAEDWGADGSSLTPLEVRAEGAIEDASGHRQVDFANQYLGGGVLTGGCVQEEIRFALAPELLMGMILSPRMNPEEAIVLRGTERFSRTRGYARSLTYAGAFDDPCVRASDVRSGEPGGSGDSFCR